MQVVKNCNISSHQQKQQHFAQAALCQLTICHYRGNEVMFSSAFVCLCVCLFDYYITENYSTDFHKIRWKGGIQQVEETVRFCGNYVSVSVCQVLDVM